MVIVLCWTLAAWAARAIERSWWSPGALLALSMWVSATGTAVFAPEYPMSLPAMLVLIALNLLISYGVFIGRSMVRAAPRAVELRLRARGGLLMFGLICSGASFAVTLQVLGIGAADLLSPLGVMRAAQQATFVRYTQGLSFPITYNIFNALFLSYAMAVAIHFGQAGRVEWRFMLPVAIYIVTNMLITTRAPILMMIIMMILAAVYAAHLRRPARALPALFARRSLHYFLITAAVIAGIFFLFQVLRFGEHSHRSPADVWSHLRRWPWGSLPGFSLWFDSGASAFVERLPGSYTFMGIFDLLGLESRVTGAFTDYLFLTPSEPANIYTLFRGLYLDFGWIGSGAFMLGIGITAGVAIAAHRAWAIPVYVAITGLMAYAFVFSFWAYTANIVALLVLPFVLKTAFTESRGT